MLFLSLFLILINLKLDSHDYLFKAHVRPREIFRGFLALCFLMNDFHLVKYVPEGLWLTLGPPTSERILPGENLSE